MNEENLLVLKNVLNDDNGFKFIRFLLMKLGAFDKGINFQNSDKEIFRTVAKREQGFWLLDNCYKADFDKTVEIMKENYKEV